MAIQVRVVTGGQSLVLLSLTEGQVAVPMFFDTALSIPVPFPAYLPGDITVYLTDGWATDLSLAVSQADGTSLGTYIVHPTPGAALVVTPRATALQDAADLSRISGGAVSGLLPLGVYLWTPHTSVSTRLFTANGEVVYGPVFFSQPCVVSEYAVEITTAAAAGSLARLGAYAMNSSGMPGSVLDDAGTIASDAVGARGVTGRSVALPVGWSFFAVAQQGSVATQATLRSTVAYPLPVLNSGSTTPTTPNVAQNSYTSSGVTGAFASAPAVTAGNANPLRIQFKLSATF